MTASGRHREETGAAASGAFVPAEQFVVGPVATGPLSGATFAVKDLIDVAGHVTGGGNPHWRATHAAAERNAPAVERLLAAGATLVGKTISDELAFSLEGDNHHYGRPPNPAAPGRLSGGSSSGSASAVAAGLCDLALGTDTGGSVRIPASFCGILGFRPTHGRIPLDGVIPFGPSYDTVGWFARDPELLRIAGHALLGDGRATPIRRLLLAADVVDVADRAVAAAVDALVEEWPVEDEILLFAGEGPAMLEAYRVLQGFEIWQSLGDWIDGAGPAFGPELMERFSSASAIPSEEAEAWRPWRARFRTRMARLLPPGTAAVMPTSPTVALRHDRTRAEVGDFYRRALAMGAIAGHAGLPQVTLPVATANGLPVGVSLIAGVGEDEALLDCAAMLMADPWEDQ